MSPVIFVGAGMLLVLVRALAARTANDETAPSGTPWFGGTAFAEHESAATGGTGVGVTPGGSGVGVTPGGSGVGVTPGGSGVGVGVTPGGSGVGADALYAGTVQLPQPPPPLHDASDVRTTSAMNAEMYGDDLNIFMILNLELHAEAEIRTIVRLTDRRVRLGLIVLCAHAAVNVQR